MTDARLTVPHPHLYDRLFVLAPMAAIAPEFIDPVTEVSISSLYHRLADRIDNGLVENQEIKESDWGDF